MPTGMKVAFAVWILAAAWYAEGVLEQRAVERYGHGPAAKAEAPEPQSSLQGKLLACGDDPLCIEAEMLLAGYRWQGKKGWQIAGLAR